MEYLFIDIAIGAPLEDEGRGAVYIFKGSKRGLEIPHSQKITAKNINLSLRGFGAVISKGLDINNDQYPGVL